MSNPKRPTDVNERAKLIVDLLTGEKEEENPDAGKNAAAMELGKSGGKARAEKLTPEQRKEIAAKAAKTRWGENNK